MPLPIPAWPQFKYDSPPTFVRMYGVGDGVPETPDCRPALCWCFPVQAGDRYNYIIDVSHLGLPDGTGVLIPVDDDGNELTGTEATFTISNGFMFVNYTATTIPGKCYRLQLDKETFTPTECTIGLKFDGSNVAKFESTSLTAGNVGTSNYTIGLWLRIDAIPASGNNSVVFGRHQDNDPVGFWLYELVIGDTGQLIWAYTTPGDAINVGSTATSLTPGNWYYINIQRLDGETQFYINGVADGTPTGDSNQDFTFSAPLEFGMMDFNAEDPIYEYGQFTVANWALYTEALPVEDMLALYNAGICVIQEARASKQLYYRFAEQQGETAYEYLLNIQNIIAVEFIPPALDLDGEYWESYSSAGEDLPEVSYDFATDCFCPEPECYTALITVTDDGDGVLPYRQMGDPQGVFQQFAQRLRFRAELIPMPPVTDGRVEVNSRGQTKTIHKRFRDTVQFDTEWMPTNVIRALSIAMALEFYVGEPGNEATPLPLVIDGDEPDYQIAQERPFRHRAKLRTRLVSALTSWKKGYCDTPAP